MRIRREMRRIASQIRCDCLKAEKIGEENLNYFFEMTVLVFNIH